MSTQNVFEAILSQTKFSDEGAEAKLREYHASFIDDWYSKFARDLPDWDWARYGNRSWEQRCDPKLLAFVKAWPVFSLDKAKQRLVPRSLVVTARTGSGKSTAVCARLHLAASNLRKATIDGKTTIKYPPPIAWYTEQQLLKASWDDDETMSRARKVQLLVLDELGFAGGDQAAKGKTPVILDVLCSRYDKGLATVVTSGMSLDQLAARYGSAIVRRLQNDADVFDGAAMQVR